MNTERDLIDRRWCVKLPNSLKSTFTRAAARRGMTIGGLITTATAAYIQNGCSGDISETLTLPDVTRRELAKLCEKTGKTPAEIIAECVVYCMADDDQA